jgi:hypothetical protein
MSMQTPNFDGYTDDELVAMIQGSQRTLSERIDKRQKEAAERDKKLLAGAGLANGAPVHKRGRKPKAESNGVGA